MSSSVASSGNYTPNYCSLEGYTFMPPGEPETEQSNNNSGQCIDALAEAALSAGACAIATAAAIESGGLAGPAAAVECAIAAHDGVDAYNACK
jgi:hypothetical protein